jgi:hypothetical protein
MDTQNKNKPLTRVLDSICKQLPHYPELEEGGLRVLNLVFGAVLATCASMHRQIRSDRSPRATACLVPKWP